MRSLVTLLLVVGLLLAGCSGQPKPDDDGPETSQSASAAPTAAASASPTRTASTSSSAPAPANRAPTAGLAPSSTTGKGPLTVNFTLTGSDPDGDALTWTLDLGDGSDDATGSSLPANVGHIYAPGNYTVRLEVSDGRRSTTAAATVSVLADDVATPPPSPVAFTGTATGLCGDAGFILTLMEGECFPDGVLQHNFTVPPGVTNLTFSLNWTFQAPAVTDLDVYILDGAGKEVAQGSCANIAPLPNPEVPPGEPFFSCTSGTSEAGWLDGIEVAQAQTWTAVIYPYQAYELPYTLTITMRS